MTAPIDPIGSGTSTDIWDAWMEYPKRALYAQSAKQTENPARAGESQPPLIGPSLNWEAYFRFQREMELWRVQHELVGVEREVGRHVPRYGFEEYRAMRAAILEDAVRYIGRSLHIAARLALHHPDIPVSWNLCFHLFSKNRNCIPLNRDIDDYFTEPSAPSRSAREQQPKPNVLNTEDVDPSEKRQNKKENGVVSINHLKNLKRIFMPVAHILAAMDVIACRAYLPILPPDSSFLPHHPSEAETDNLLRAGRTFMDFPHDDRLTLATLGYALWFQQWGLAKTSKGSRKMLSQNEIERLESDLPLPEITKNHPVIDVSEDRIFLEDPIGKDKYKVFDPYAELIVPRKDRPTPPPEVGNRAFGEDLLTIPEDYLRQWDSDNPLPPLEADDFWIRKPTTTSPASRREEPRKRAQTLAPPALLLPPLPDDIVEELRSFNNVVGSRGDIRRF
ncbi:hypothetical protein HK28_10960 [Acetobacter sp. DsW_063]|nr:hypothetical protein HK28_10960 [Acetobacter sp. DsW_063]